MNTAMQFSSMLAALTYSAIGLIIFAVSFIIVDKLTPYHLWREVVQEKNVALAIIVGSVAISIALIVAAAIH